MTDNFSRLSEKDTLRVGSVVRSVKGRDRKRVFVVIELDYSNPVAPAVIANGKLHKIEARKHKNPAHLRPVGALGETDTKQLLDCLTDSKIAEICDRYDIS